MAPSKVDDKINVCYTATDTKQVYRLRLDSFGVVGVHHEFHFTFLGWEGTTDRCRIQMDGDLVFILGVD
jgi:hypothetical protein